MSFFSGSEADSQTFRQTPLELASGVFLIRNTHSSGTMLTNLNSLLITGPEPILVDTGMALHREQWFEDVFSLVSPAEVRWVFVTHDDLDHTGNLLEVLERCPNATLVTNLAASWRTSVTFDIPAERIHSIENGAEFTLGQRKLLAMRPPVFDSPYTLGLFDSTSGVYYASDAFCTPMPVEAVNYVDELADDYWAQGMATYHHLSLCPWLALVDKTKLRAEIKKLENLSPRLIAGAHSPAINSKSINRAYEIMAELPSTPAKPLG